MKAGFTSAGVANRHRHRLARVGRGPRLLVALLAALVLSLALASGASAFVYWTNWAPNGTTIGRANLDGTSPNQSFITGGNAPCGIAVDANYIYWANNGGQVGRANINGTGATQDFITGTSTPCGVAVNASYIYWANQTGSIGRANLNGTSPTQNFIPGTGGICDVAIDASHIYWDTYSGIGRANLNGTSPDPSFMTGVTACGLGVDANHIYWADSGANKIGRANLNGTSPDPNFMTGVTGAGDIAIDANHLYWAGSTTIGRANLDGTLPNASFIPAATGPAGVAVDSLSLPSNTKILSGKIKRKKRTATLSFTADSATGFECALIKPKKKGKQKKQQSTPNFSACSSPKSYKHLGPGKYTFQVRGVNSSGTDPNPAVKKFKI